MKHREKNHTIYSVTFEENEISNRAKNLFEEIKAENFPELKKNTKP